MSPLAESTLEEVALSWLADLGYAVLHGQEIARWINVAERESFDRRVSQLVDRIGLDARTSRTLAAMRGSLLPKLLSGEIRVGEAAEVVGA